MFRKQKSGCEKRKKEEEKVRSEISNRPGQLKISNFFKDIPVLDESAIENDAETDEFVADSDPIEGKLNSFEFRKLITLLEKSKHFPDFRLYFNIRYLRSLK